MDTLESDEQPCTEAYLLKLITAYYNIPLALMYVLRHTSRTSFSISVTADLAHPSNWQRKPAARPLH
jgi:hypothetical protein